MTYERPNRPSSDNSRRHPISASAVPHNVEMTYTDHASLIHSYFENAQLYFVINESGNNGKDPSLFFFLHGKEASEGQESGLISSETDQRRVELHL